MINTLMEQLSSEYKTVNAYDCNISPCVDCRYCREHSGCAEEDEMQEVYEYIRICDNVVIASPVHFSELSAKLLGIGSRLQMFDCMEMFGKKTPDIKPKKGGIILAGGGVGKPEGAVRTAKILLHTMNCKQIAEPVFSLRTDRVPAYGDKAVLQSLRTLAEFLG